MTMPRRFAALAVCLLALAAGASAACSEGSFSIELVGADSTLASNDIAKCLSSATVSITTGCAISISAGATDNSFVPALWSSDPGSYKQFKLCPATSSAAVTAASDSVADVLTGLKLALNGYVYGFNDAKTAALKSSGIDDVAFAAAGKFTVTWGTTTPKLLTYAIRATTGTTTSFDGANVVVSDGTGLAAAEFKAEADVGVSCAEGRYGMLVGSIKLCPLCPAGTTGDGNGCTACAAGKASDVVGRTDTLGCGATCVSGEYAQEGSSNCLPCPMHFYSTGSTGECTPCPANTYAWLPGSTTCVSCDDGVVTAGTTAVTAGVAGSAILTLDAALTCASHTGSYAIDMLGKCDLGTAATTKLALEVAADCSITIKPIGYAGCSDPNAVDGVLALFPRTASANGLDADGKYTYTYNDLLIRAYYTSATTISTLLPGTDGGASSFMLNIGVNDAPTKKVDVTFYAATNKPGESSDPTGKSCTQVATVAGGNLATISQGTCTAGSYKSATSCVACPQGKVCASNAATDCTASNANPYLGQTTGACQSCDPVTTRYTSLAAAAYCTVPYLDRTCSNDMTVNSVLIEYSKGGYEWDESAGACVKCRPGTHRAVADLATVPECQECPAGYYSGEGAADCTPCPAGQYSPTTGMADQATTANPMVHCLRCPIGSIALTNGVSIKDDDSAVSGTELRNGAGLLIGADHCEACPQGTYAGTDTTALPTADLGTQGDQNAKACTLCPSGTYRTGDASLNNNVCKKVPAGYKVTSLLLAATTKGAFAIGTCSAGSVSYWTGELRTPSDATACYNCEDDNGVGLDKSNTYAPRPGMAACLACKGGYAPNAAHTTCDQCAVGTYRSFYTKSEICADCAAGSEVGPSGRQACTLCRPGYYKTTTATTDYCSECPINTYMPKPGASAAVGVTNGCIYCPKGTETQDTANSECTPCAIGYYNPAAATAASTTPACIKAPAGTYVNTTGAYFATQCPLGTYNADTAQDSCEPCPPGQYANTLGNKACKTCPAGTYSGGQASTCKACAAGYYSPAGSGACSPCKPGTYSSSARAGTCALCPKGKQCPTPATTTPRDCPAGTFAAKDGSTLCTPCPVNTFSSTSGLTKCTACSAGTNTRGLTGQKACQAVRVASLRRSVL